MNHQGQGLSLTEIENLLQHLDTNVDFYHFIDSLIGQSPWKDLPDSIGFYKTICLDLAKEVQIHNLAMGALEPSYHGRHHFRDVCTSLTLLLNQNLTDKQSTAIWQLESEDFWLLLLCAIGHDYGHDGSVNTSPQEIERRSVKKIEQCLQKSRLTQDEKQNLMSQVEPIILATDPAFLKPLLEKFTTNPTDVTKIDCLSMLMVESDLLASTLPKRGAILGQLLSQEWQVSNPQGALTVASQKGRVGFLEFIRFISPYAITLGMEEIRKESIEQLKK